MAESWELPERTDFCSLATSTYLFVSSSVDAAEGPARLFNARANPIFMSVTNTSRSIYYCTLTYSISKGKKSCAVISPMKPTKLSKQYSLTNRSEQSSDI